MRKVSFCISTYNRVDKIFKLVNELLTYKGDEIEVIVCDNNSSDETKNLLSKIIDERFHYHLNTANIGAIPNYMKAISKGNGQYVFFSTDKDSLDVNGVQLLLNFFAKNPDVLSGYAKIDTYQESEAVIFDKGLEGLTNIAYLSQHPTGYFFRNDELKKLEVFNNFTDVEKVGVFPFEFIIAELCVKGKSALLNIPLFYMETLEEVGNIKSYSYSGSQNNLYFAPYQRFKTARRYIDHAKNLILLPAEKKKVVKAIFKYGLSSSTIGYKLMMENEIVCHHYSIATERISFLKIIKNDFIYSTNFIFNCNYSNIFSRIIIAIEMHIQFLVKKLNR